MRTITYTQLFLLFFVVLNSCKTAKTDPKPTTENSANIPGTSCMLSEIKYFSKADNSFLGAMQLKYSAGNKLSNVLYYNNGQNPGDNGYVTLVYNSDETLKQMINYFPSRIIDFGFATSTIPAINFSNDYVYANGKLSEAFFGNNTNVVFQSNSKPTQNFKYTYDANGKLQNQKYEFSFDQLGFVYTNTNSTEYQSYAGNRPSYVVQTFNTKTIYPNPQIAPTNITLRNFQKNEYDANGNKTNSRRLFFPDSIIAANSGKSLSEIENFSDSISVNISTTFDLSKPNPSYAFRYLRPENPMDIDMNLPVTIKAGCLITTIEYTFDEKNGVPLTAQTTYSIDGDCKLADEFGKLTNVSGFSLPQNDTYIKYYYSGCK